MTVLIVIIVVLAMDKFQYSLAKKLVEKENHYWSKAKEKIASSVLERYFSNYEVLIENLHILNVV